MTSEDAGEVVSMKLAVEVYEIEQLADLTCSSGGTQEEVQVTLLNDTDTDVYMHWINYECGEGDGERIAAGEEFTFTTMMVTNSSSAMLMVQNSLICH